MGRIKGLLSWNIYSKRESWTTALSLAEQGPKGSPPEKNTTGKKKLLVEAAYAPGTQPVPRW
jgi:hypothetical protein